VAVEVALGTGMSCIVGLAVVRITAATMRITLITDSKAELLLA
jgi:hypothetical protein